MEHVTPAPSERPETSYTWEERPAGLVVRFPSPPGEASSVGCAIAILVVGYVVFLLLAILLAAMLSRDPGDLRLWVPAGALLLVSGILFPYLRRGVREAKLPPLTVAPSVLSVSDQTLAIERTGEDRDMDVSWQLDEIADLRICPSTQVPIAFGIVSLLAKAYEMRANGRLLRISVMQPSGEVDDVLLRVPHDHWAAELEERLRRALRLPGA